MKPSPLQLKWLVYPAAQFEIIEGYASTPEPVVQSRVDATVTFNADGQHVVSVSVSNVEDEPIGYTYAVTAVGQFEVDLDRAKKAYPSRSASHLANMVAVNIARIVYASIREFLAAMTARAPYGTARLSSVILETGDVTIGSDVAQSESLQKIFGATEEEIAELRSKGALAED